MYIDEDRAGGLYAAAMAKVNFSETLYNDTDKKDDAQTDIAEKRWILWQKKKKGM